MYRKDSLTGLYGRDYLYAKYDDYKSDLTHAVLIDFRHLKHINDNHGHLVGDQILNYFAKQLQEKFSQSILTRLGGDEFFIMTNDEIEVIKIKLEEISLNIKNNFNDKIKNGFIPFNSGIFNAMPNFDMTYTRVDLAMYEAKEKNKLYSYFQQYMLDKKHFEKEFVEYIKTILKEQTFNYQERKIDDDLIDLTLLDPYYSKVFTDEKSEILKKNNLISMIDYFNIYYILSNIANNKNTFIINIYHETLMEGQKFIDFLKNQLLKNNIEPNKICININTKGYNGNSETIVEKINACNSIGAKISIGNVDLNNQQYLLPVLCFCDIDYIKIEQDVYYETLKNKNVAVVFKGILGVLKHKNTQPILINIDEKDYENDFIIKNKLLVRKK